MSRPIRESSMVPGWMPPDLRSRGLVLGTGAGAGGLDDPFAPQGSGSSYPETPRSLQIPLPEIYPIPDAQQFQRRLSFLSPGVGIQEPAGLTMQLPDSNIGVIRLFGIGLLNMTAVTDVGWSLLIDGNPYPGYNNVGFFPGLVPRVTLDQSDILIRIPQGAKISVQFENRDGAAYQWGANYYGWSYTPESAARWNGLSTSEG